MFKLVLLLVIKLTLFCRIANGLLPEHLYSYLKFPSQKNYLLRSASTTKINPIPSRSKTFRKTFFPYCTNEWNNLKPDVRNAEQMSIFQKMIIIEKKENSLFLFTIQLVQNSLHFLDYN